MQKLKLLFLCGLSLLSFNSLASQVVCSGNSSSAYFPYAAVDDLNRALSRIPNIDKMTITAPVISASLNNERSTVYTACVSVN